MESSRRGSALFPPKQSFFQLTAAVVPEDDLSAVAGPAAPGAVSAIPAECRCRYHVAYVDEGTSTSRVPRVPHLARNAGAAQRGTLRCWGAQGRAPHQLLEHVNGCYNHITHVIGR